MEVMDKFVKYNENSHGNQALIHLRRPTPAFGMADALVL